MDTSAELSPSPLPSLTSAHPETLNPIYYPPPLNNNIVAPTRPVRRHAPLQKTKHFIFFKQDLNKEIFITGMHRYEDIARGPCANLNLVVQDGLLKLHADIINLALQFVSFSNELPTRMEPQSLINSVTKMLVMRTQTVGPNEIVRHIEIKTVEADTARPPPVQQQIHHTNSTPYTRD
jgi:hypothetical protein